VTGGATGVSYGTSTYGTRGVGTVGTTISGPTTVGTMSYGGGGATLGSTGAYRSVGTMGVPTTTYTGGGGLVSGSTSMGYSSTTPITAYKTGNYTTGVAKGGGLFDMLDRNHDGVITRNELTAAVTGAMPTTYGRA